MTRFSKIRPYLLLAAIMVAAVLYFNGTRIIKKIPGVDLFHSTSTVYSPAPVQEIDWNKVLVGYSVDPYSMQRVSLMLDRVERERSYGRVGLADQGSYHQELSRVSENSVSSLTQAIGNTQGQRVSRGGMRLIEQNDEMEMYRTPAAIVGGLVAVYTGRTIRYRISENIKFGSRTQINQNQFGGQQFQVITPWINAMLAYTNINQAGNSGQSQDALQTSVSKEFNDIGLKAKASYGNAGTTSYGVSKAVTQEVSVSYDESTRQGDSARNRSVGVGYSHGF